MTLAFAVATAGLEEQPIATRPRQQRLDVKEENRCNTATDNSITVS
jgi:hypothetical protein